MSPNVIKIYISNFLVGLVFWYGIEKLFMQGIGIDAVGIGIVGASLLAFNLLFDIPSGVLADKWSRKGMLVVAAVAMVVASLILGLSTTLWMYVIGHLVYGIYVVSTSGTFQALMYDSLHQDGKADQYSKIMGRAYALFLVGAGVANLASGFLAGQFGYQANYFLSIVPCIINVFVILSIKEPTFHKAEHKEKMLPQLKTTLRAVGKNSLLRGLVIIMTLLTSIEVFKSDFGQLYFLRYVSAPEMLGILWAAYAFTWALGSVIAYKLHAKLNILVIAAVIPLLLMSFIDGWVSIILFMIQATAAAALLNQIETRTQDATPSSVRASVLSVVSSIGRVVAIPVSILLGQLIVGSSVLHALWAVTVVGVAALLFWWWVSQRNNHSKLQTT